MELTIKGTPVAMQRHRTNKRFGHNYLPKKSKDFKKLIQNEYVKKYKVKPFFNSKEDEYYLNLNTYVKIPKSYTKKRRKEIIEKGLRPNKKPDIDNYLKIVMDALNEYAYIDDAQITSIKVDKNYCEYKEDERIEIYIAKEEKK